MSIQYGGDLDVFRNVIAGNSSVGYGGGIALGADNENIVQFNSLVRNQSNEQGGAVYVNSKYHTLANNTILDNKAGAGQGAVHLQTRSTLENPIRYNNMYDNSVYALFYGAPQDAPNLNAQYNWWGSANPVVIPTQIWDWFDDASLAQVDYSNWLEGHWLAAPISPPSGLAAATENDTITLTWSDNPESDLAGYKLYFSESKTLMVDAVLGDLTGTDVGNTTSAAITNLPLGIYYMGVTACDTDADGEDDWTDGNESWFSTIEEVHIGSDPQASFSASPLSGEVPHTVAFTDASTGDFDTWLWAFGDGGTSTEQNPTHEYTDSGVYTVSLTIDGPLGSTTETKTAYITMLPVGSDFQADFSASPLSGEVPLTVAFTDTSTGDIDSWMWTFGDAGTSTEQNPTHIYSESGVYTVTLTITGSLGSITETKTAYITVLPQSGLFEAKLFLPLIEN
jgi:PKD repeat protein